MKVFGILDLRHAPAPSCIVFVWSLSLALGGGLGRLASFVGSLL